MGAQLPNKIMSEKTTRLYELGFILVPATPESEVPAKVDALKNLIKGVGGEVTTEGTPEYIDLAYTMERSVGSKKYKYSQGYFGYLKFETTPESLEALKKALDANLDLVRYILIKTDAQNTIVFKKPKVDPIREDDSEDDEELSDDLEEVELDASAHESLPELSEDIEDEESDEKEAE